MHFGDRRLGRFKVSGELIERASLGDKSLAAVIYAGVIPLRVEHLAYEDAFDIIALCEDFAPIGAGEMVRSYELRVTAHLSEQYDPETGDTKRTTTYMRTFEAA